MRAGSRDPRGAGTRACPVHHPPARRAAVHL